MLLNLSAEDWTRRVILCMRLRCFSFSCSLHATQAQVTSIIRTMQSSLISCLCFHTFSSRELTLKQRSASVTHAVPVPADSTAQGPHSLLWLWGLCPDPWACLHSHPPPPHFNCTATLSLPRRACLFLRIFTAALPSVCSVSTPLHHRFLWVFSKATASERTQEIDTILCPPLPPCFIS